MPQPYRTYRFRMTYYLADYQTILFDLVIRPPRLFASVRSKVSHLHHASHNIYVLLKAMEKADG